MFHHARGIARAWHPTKTSSTLPAYPSADPNPSAVNELIGEAKQVVDLPAFPIFGHWGLMEKNEMQSSVAFAGSSISLRTRSGVIRIGLPPARYETSPPALAANPRMAKVLAQFYQAREFILQVAGLSLWQRIQMILGFGRLPGHEGRQNS